MLADGDAAVLIEEKDLTGALLVEKVRGFAENPAYRAVTEQNIRRFAVFGTLDRIYELVCDAVEEKREEKRK